MVNEAKKKFLQTELLPLVAGLDPQASSRWGKMNVQQMVEHVTDFFKVSTNRLHYDLTTPFEHLPKYREFLMSEKEFRENTRAAMLPEDPFPIRHQSFNEAVEELKQEVDHFFNYFSGKENSTTLHPAFGELNFEEWVQLHHKHVKHHLKQFGTVIDL